MPESSMTCWVVTEGLAGTEGQCTGLAEALGLTPVVKRIALKAPWKQLSPWLDIGHGYSLAAGSDDIAPPYPDLLITSGRKSVGIARHIRRASKGRTFCVHIQDPRIDPAAFDLVIAPQHDPVRGGNVLTTAASLHRVTPQKLAEARTAFQDSIGKLPWPRVAVLVGGNSRAHTMTADHARLLGQQLRSLADKHGTGLMVTVSRRTGAENTQILRDKLADVPSCLFWDGTGENPLFGFLALADYIIVTEDSASMTSEALSTGKPVHIARLSGGGKRLDAFHSLLQEQGYTRPFTGVLEEWSYTPPGDTEKAAADVLRRMNDKKAREKEKPDVRNT